MLRWRLIAAAGILIPFFLLLWLDDQHHGGHPGVYLALLAVVASGLAAQELNQLLVSAGLRVSRAANIVGVLAATVLTLTPLLWIHYPEDCPVGKMGRSVRGAAMGMGGLFLVELRRYREPGESIQRLAGGALAVGYVGLLMACLIQLRLLEPARLGLVGIVSTILIVKLSDAGAYFVGRKLGRTKLTRVSPGKTIEGVVGGLGFAMLGGVMTRELIVPQLLSSENRGSLGAYLGYAATLMLAGLIGDLAESLLTRDAGMKDSSRWLPGLGGVLDVVDSLLAAAPASLLWWTTGWLIASSHVQ